MRNLVRAAGVVAVLVAVACARETTSEVVPSPSPTNDVMESEDKMTDEEKMMKEDSSEGSDDKMMDGSDDKMEK